MIRYQRYQSAPIHDHSLVIMGFPTMTSHYVKINDIHKNHGSCGYKMEWLTRGDTNSLLDTQLGFINQYEQI